MKRECGEPEEFVSGAEAVAASIIENTLGEVRMMVPEYGDRLIVLTSIEKALRDERDDVYEAMEGSRTEPDEVVLSLVQSFDSQSMAEPLISSEVDASLSELVSAGVISDDQAKEIKIRLGL